MKRLLIALVRFYRKNNIFNLIYELDIRRNVLNTSLCCHFFRLRTASASHPQMRQVAIELLKMLQDKYPVFFEDIEAQ